MKKLLLLGWAVVSANLLSAQKDSALIILQHVNVIDGYSGKPRTDVTIRIEKGKIAAVNKQYSKISPKAIVLNLTGNRKKTQMFIQP